MYIHITIIHVQAHNIVFIHVWLIYSRMSFYTCSLSVWPFYLIILLGTHLCIYSSIASNQRVHIYI